MASPAAARKRYHPDASLEQRRDLLAQVADASFNRRGGSFKPEWFELMPEECCEWFKHHIQGMISFHSQQLRYWQEIGTIAHKKHDPASSRSTKSTHRGADSHHRAAPAPESAPEPEHAKVLQDQALNGGRKPVYKGFQKIFQHKGKHEPPKQPVSNPDAKRKEEEPLSHAVLDRPLVNRERNRMRHSSSGARFRIEMDQFTTKHDSRHPASTANTQFNSGVEIDSVQLRENEGFRNAPKPQRMTAEAIKGHQKRHQMTPPYVRKGDRSDVREEIRRASPIAHVTASVKGAAKLQGNKTDRQTARRTENNSSASDEEETVITIMQLAHRGPEQRGKGGASRSSGPMQAHKQAAAATEAAAAKPRPHRPPGPPPARAMAKPALPAWVTPGPLDRQQRSISAQPPFDDGRGGGGGGGGDDDAPPPPPPAGSPPSSQVRDDSTRRVLASRPPPRAGHTINSRMYMKQQAAAAAASDVDNARSPIDRGSESAKPTQRAVYQTPSRDKSSQRSRQHRSEHSSRSRQEVAFDNASSSSTQRPAHNPKRLTKGQSASSSARNNKEKATTEVAPAKGARFNPAASGNEATLGPTWSSKRFSEPMALHSRPRHSTSRSRNASVSLGGVCGTCGCDDFSLNAFKAGSCNNCFHEHQN